MAHQKLMHHLVSEFQIDEAVFRGCILAIPWSYMMMLTRSQNYRLGADPSPQTHTVKALTLQRAAYM